MEFGQQDGGVGAVGDVFADVFIGDVALFVDDEDSRSGDAVVVEVVDLVVTGNFMVLGGIEDWECCAGVGDHGACPLKVVHADGQYLGVLLLDAGVVALQLDELPEADPSEEASVEDEDDVLVATEVGQSDVRYPVGDGESEFRCSVDASGRRRSAGNHRASDERGREGNQEHSRRKTLEDAIDWNTHSGLEASQGFENFFTGDLMGWRIADALPRDVAVGVDDENGG